MTDDLDLFADLSSARCAYAKMGKRPEGFRFYEMGLMGVPPLFSDTIKFKGAVFREARKGPNKGSRTIRVNFTEREVYVTRTEIALFEAKEAT